MNVLPYKDLVARLRTLGLTKGQVGALMPDWWDGAAANSSAGAWEFVLMVSRRLGLDAVALAGGEVRRLGAVSTPRFKHTARVSSDDLGPASLIASALAKAAFQACTAAPGVPFRPNGSVRISDGRGNACLAPLAPTATAQASEGECTLIGTGGAGTITLTAS